jgi:hypothetical protein
MDPRRAKTWSWAATLAGVVSMGGIVLAEDLRTDQATVQRHTDEAFQRLGKERHFSGDLAAGRADMSNASSTTTLPNNLQNEVQQDLLIGHGQGDLSKGKLVCQRVSELAARADLAKQIRVLIKEHATDRIRERTGREPEQDIEVVREELVQEYLQGVKITDRRVDEAQKTCSATAVMPTRPAPTIPSPIPSPAATTTR